MECFGRQGQTELTQDGLRRLRIEAPDEQSYRRVRQRWDGIAKPLDGLGRMEELIARIGAITRTADVALRKKALLILCADNGITEEGVSQCSASVTRAVACSMGKGESPAGRMARAAGAVSIPVDIGMLGQEPVEGVLDRKVRCGTENFRKRPAMERQEALCAIGTGIALVRELRDKGFDLLALGEMGIGNTTTSSAVAAALLGRSAEETVGRGAGLDDAGLERKRCVIREALETYGLYRADALTVLRTVGGLDIAGLAGACIGGALFHIPIVLDGVISLTAALAAERLVPGTREYLLPSHLGREPAAAWLLRELGMEPVLHADLALGEGTGAVMLFPLLELTLSVYGSGATFSGIQVEQYRRWEKEQ
ncbi:MAG: nicotinate-nucleotide--dimethylbenzimidazole phosphoribosyltransferase [Eubacteriales bacterium]|nr:nicotinate-nucleotide--dimethylbenzimidazole phosphoribosyltransferase [Eubacteriales bacterium]